jgi:sugar phosphate isomerase/epimerase
MHSRVSLHQVGFLAESTAAFIGFCREIGVGEVTLANPLSLGPAVLDEALAALAPGGVRVGTVVQPFARYPNLERDEGEAAARLDAAIGAAAALGCRHVYTITGGRGALGWEAAAERFAALIAPCIDHASERGVAISVETANLFNADIHIAHTLDDTIRLAELAGIGVTLDIGAIWAESDLAGRFARALPRTRLVQLCDWVPGDRDSPCKAVIGDGMVPIERIVTDLLELGYEGALDLELVGTRIAAEGHRAAFARAAEALSDLLVKLGA